MIDRQLTSSVCVCGCLVYVRGCTYTCRNTAYNKAVIEDMKASMAAAVTHLGWRRRASNNLPLNVDHL